MKWFKLFLSFLMVFGVQFAGSWFTEQGMEVWYPLLRKAPWTPPSIVFGIVWPILYISLAISLWIVWIQPQKKIRALSAFFTQLAFNFFWPICFFYYMDTFLGLICLTLLIIAVIWTLWEFYPISKLAHFILYPYLIWLLFALTLNWYLWYYN